MRIMILGAAGMLGHKLSYLLPKLGHEVIAVFRQPTAHYSQLQQFYTNTATAIGEIDVCNTDFTALLKQYNPGMLVNCVGIVKQLPTASSRYLSTYINSYLPHLLAKACQKQQTKLIHIGTDCVFDGKQGPYAVNDISNAQDDYGKSKFLGETTPEETAALTLRSSIIGREIAATPHGLVEWFLRSAHNGVTGFKNALYTGFTTNEFANIIHHITTHGMALNGVYQVASETISKYELLNLLNKSYQCHSAISADNTFHCDRRLMMDSFTEQTGYTAPSWPEMVQQMYENDLDLYTENKSIIA